MGEYWNLQDVRTEAQEEPGYAAQEEPGHRVVDLICELRGQEWHKYRSMGGERQQLEHWE